MSDQPTKEGEGKSLAELCVQRRKEVRRKENLSSTAKLLFDALTDNCFLGKYSVGFGIVRIGKPALADELGCSVPTITRAQSELMPGELWTRTGWYEGHEITIWFLRGVASNQLEFDQFTAGVTKAPRTKVAPRVERARNGHGHFCRISKPSVLLEKSEATAELNGHNGHSCDGATVNPTTATTSILTVGSRQNQPSGHGKNDVGERSNLTGPNGHSNHIRHGKNDAGTTSGVTRYKDTSDTEEEGKPLPASPPPPDNAFETWRKGLEGQFPSHLRALEKKIRAKLETAGSETVKAGLRRQLKAVCDTLLPPVADAVDKPGPTRAVKPGPAKPVLSQAEQDAIREQIQRGALRAAVEAAR